MSFNFLILYFKNSVWSLLKYKGTERTAFKSFTLRLDFAKSILFGKIINTSLFGNFFCLKLIFETV